MRTGRKIYSEKAVVSVYIYVGITYTSDYIFVFKFNPNKPVRIIRRRAFANKLLSILG